MRQLFTFFSVLALTFSLTSAFSQLTPGKIIRAATNGGAAILDPNGDGYVSTSTAGWTVPTSAGGNDTTAAVSEIWYTPVKSYGGEPCCDLRRGPDHKFSDFVPDSKNNGVYLNWLAGGTDATSYLRIRMRMGSIIPGSKGFSLLVDTDGKFGATGTNKDPNYVAKTTGINGNPGFELEIVLETGFRVAIYNIDGLGNPSEGIDRQAGLGNIVFNNNWMDRSQVSVAATTEGGDPDYFLDWYVTLAELKQVKNQAGTTLVTTLGQDGTGQTFRIIPTTVMAPKPSTAGPISDMYGYSDSAGVVNQPPVCMSCDRSTTCTAAPVLVSATSTSVTLYWVKGNTADAGYAKIQLYKGGTTAVGTPFTIASSMTPTTILLSNISGGTLTTSDNVTATATGATSGGVAVAGESVSSGCFTSNTVTLCSDATRPPTPAIQASCNSGKGLTFTNYSTSYTVTADNLVTGGSDAASNGTAAQNFTFATGQALYYGGCGGSPMPQGYYKVTYSVNGCASKPYLVCNPGNGGGALTTTTTPVITTPNIAGGESILRTTKTIMGTAEAGATVYLNVDSMRIATATVNGLGNFSFSDLDLSSPSDTNIYVLSVTSAKCAATTANYPIRCYNEPPSINQDTVTRRQIVGQPIAGFSNGNAGDEIVLYKLSSTGVKTQITSSRVVVQSGGKWSSDSVMNVVPGNTKFYATAGDFSYVATLKTASCTVESVTSGIDTLSTSTTPDLCNVTLSSVSASNAGGGSTTFVTNGSVNSNVPLYSDATSISGTFDNAQYSAITPAGSKIRVNVLINGSVIATTDASSNSWSVSVPSGSLYQGAILQVSVVQLTASGASGGFAERTCSSLKVTCACAASHLPTAPAFVGSATKTIQSGQSATFTISNPVNNYFYSIKDSATGKSLSKGIAYTATTNTTSVSGRLTGNGDLSITTIPVTQTTTADVAATAIGGTESCTSSARAFIVLPIILTEFKGVATLKENILTWKTASEINASHFVLEKSTDGILFNQLTVIGVNGVASTYSYNDAIKDTVSYYRLRMVDIDGNYKFSNIIMLKSKGASVTLNTVRPNPFTTTVSFSLYLNKAQSVQYILADAAGRIVMKGAYAGNKGVNEMKLNNLDKLQGGLYTLRILANDIMYVEKLMK